MSYFEYKTYTVYVKGVTCQLKYIVIILSNFYECPYFCQTNNIC